MSCKEKKLTTYLVTVAYDGSKFYGWAKQNSLRTVEGELNKILSAIFKLDIIVDGSSRTDTGVHAYNQYFTFSLPFLLDEKELLAIFNQHFHDDIKINSIQVVSNQYDSNPYDLRKHVASKEYRYYINVREHNPFKINYEYQYPHKISLSKIRQALALFLGEHYFYNFSGLSKTDDKSPYRTVSKIRVWKCKNQIVVSISGSGFLRYQIRYMIAAALDYSQDKVTLEEIKSYLSEDKQRKYPYPKAPASGLYLYRTVLKD